MSNMILSSSDNVKCSCNKNLLRNNKPFICVSTILVLVLFLIGVYFFNILRPSEQENSVAVINSNIIGEQLPVNSVKEDIDTSNVKGSIKYVELQYRNKTFKVIDNEVYNICKNKYSIPCKISITKNVDGTEDYELIAVENFVIPKGK